jgi:coniferyl-aldehyde dehydrogenase
VVQGDGRLAAEFAGLPFDHLFFTGSTAVGRKVAEAAAANLTPTTLELGGKSPCIIDASCDLDKAAIKIAHGKLLNAGQTCIAPDYVLLPQGRETAFGEAFARAVATLFPTITGNPDYAAIISPRHLERLQALLAQAEGEGARLQTVQPWPVTGVGAASRQMAPVLVFDVPAASKLLSEEIFGPILPVIPYAAIDDAIRYVNARPRPLALYWFGTDTGSRDHVLAQHRERRRHGERHADAHRPRKPALRRRRRKRLGRLPRRNRLPAADAAKAGDGAVQMGARGFVLPALRQAV